MSASATHAYNRQTKPHWVYRAVDATGTVLYVGCTMYPEQRMQAWANGAAGSAKVAGRWFDHVATIHWQEYPNYRTASRAERAAIEAHRPSFNVYLNPNYTMAAAFRAGATA